MPNPIQRRALALLSGGLDSMLAVKIIQNQGVEVEAVNFFTGFCMNGQTRSPSDKKERQNNHDALWAAEQLGIKLHVIDISEEYKQIVTKPRYGYGANLNPCLDCKIFMAGQASLMLNKSRSLMNEKGFDFLITGEVVGQRQMSQGKKKLGIIATDSGADERLVRPLCAQQLPETLPEREGWLDRSRLYNFHGRNRKPQLELAKSLGMEAYSQPAGGCCFLTDKYYTNKLRDLWQAKGRKSYELDDIMLLKLGRHIRPASHFKLIIGRNESDNNFLEGYRKQFPHIRIIGHQGPLTLVDGEPTQDDLLLAASIAARFSQGKQEALVQVQIEQNNKTSQLVQIKPMPTDDIPKNWYV